MISVCLASYNGAKFIHRQIESILTQLEMSDELLVTDDGSTDQTYSIVKSFNDKRIKWIPNETGQHGVNKNFENAILHSHGDIIFFSDQDDVWLPGKIDAVVKALDNSLLVVHDCIITDENLKITDASYFSTYKSRSGFFKNIWRNSYIGACMAFRRELLIYTLPIPKSFPVYYDGWYGSMAELCGKVSFIQFKGIYYRRHLNNTSCSAGTSQIPFRNRLKNRILWIYFVLSRFLKIKLCYKHKTLNKF